MGGVLAVVQEVRVVVLGIGIFSHCLKSKPVGEPLHIAQVRRYKPEGAHLQLGGEMRPMVGRNLVHCLDGEHSCHRGLSGRDEDVVVVADGELERLHLVERITRHVDFAALAFAEQHAVVAHARVSGSKATHGNGLHTSRPSIVAQVDAWHTMQGIGDVGNAQTGEILMRQQLQWCCRGHHAMLRQGIHLHLLKMLGAEGVGTLPGRRRH